VAPRRAGQLCFSSNSSKIAKDVETVRTAPLHSFLDHRLDL
jgi:hypothetical protein